MDRAVVVTGVSKGIGAATARVLAAKGCHVFGSVRELADADKLAADLGPASFTPLVMDVTDEAAVSADVAAVASSLGPARCLWGLVNNAGIHAGSDPVAYLPAPTLRRQLEVNLVAQVGVTQAFLPLLGMDRARGGPPGRICMMSSVYGNYGVPWTVREGERERGRGFGDGGNASVPPLSLFNPLSFPFFPYPILPPILISHSRPSLSPFPLHSIPLHLRALTAPPSSPWRASPSPCAGS